jgi:hypothetical protein
VPNVGEAFKNLSSIARVHSIGGQRRASFLCARGEGSAFTWRDRVPTGAGAARVTHRVVRAACASAPNPATATRMPAPRPVTTAAAAAGAHGLRARSLSGVRPRETGCLVSSLPRGALSQVPVVRACPRDPQKPRPGRSARGRRARAPPGQSSSSGANRTCTRSTGIRSGCEQRWQLFVRIYACPEMKLSWFPSPFHWSFWAEKTFNIQHQSLCYSAQVNT